MTLEADVPYIHPASEMPCAYCRHIYPWTPRYFPVRINAVCWDCWTKHAVQDGYWPPMLPWWKVAA